MANQKKHEKDDSNAQSGQGSPSLEASRGEQKSVAAEVSVQKEVKLLGTSEYHKTAIVEPSGYNTGDTATFILDGLTVKFEVNGQQQQIIKY